MADFTALKTAIQNAIKQNGNEEITGNLLQEILLAIVTTLGDGSINDLITALGSEATTRQQADGTLQQNINAEAQARQQAVSAEAQARSNADTAIGGRIDGVIDSINAINAAIGNGYVYAGIATPSSTPTTGKVFYLALTAGTYTNYGGLEVPQGINILKNNGSTWSLDSFLGIDDAPTPSSNNLIKSGGAFDFVMKNGSAFDLSAYNNGTTYADLNAALTALNALPAAFKKGGMSFRFVHTSDNTYVQYRYMLQYENTTAGNNDFKNTTNWQGVDEKVTAFSKNLITSGGVYKIINNIVTYAASDFTDGYYYELTQGMGGTAPVINAEWACLKIEVKAGQTINLKTIGGANARAYALTNTDRIILSVAPASANYSNGITLNVVQDGYLYVNTTTEFLPNASVIISDSKTRIDLLEDDVTELEDDVTELQNDISPIMSYNNEGFTDGYYYALSQGIGGTAYNSPVINAEWACLKIEVKAGQTINLKTIGGANARAYALTNTDRIILSVAPASANYSNGITLNVVQDGYLYVNTTTEFLPNVSVVISDSKTRIDRLEDDVTELQELQFSVGSSKIFNPHFDLTKDNLKILDIGNSFTVDATHYLTNIISNYNISNTYSLYEVVRGGSSFKSWVDCYKDNDNRAYSCSFLSGQLLSDVSTGSATPMDGTLFRNVLSSVKWDMIIIHQVSTYSANYELWEGNTAGGYLKEYIRILKLTNPQAKIGFYLVHSAPSNSDSNPEHSSLLRWQKISKSVKWMMANYGVDFVIPYGTAIQNIRQCSIIDSNELSDDGLHNANGLADYTASCCYFQQLFGARNGVNVIGDTFRLTVDETVAGQISVTDDTAPLAQKAAILACCDAFSISNPEENIV